jgi:hypothetical protein
MGRRVLAWAALAISACGRTDLDAGELYDGGKGRRTQDAAQAAEEGGDGVPDGPLGDARSADGVDTPCVACGRLGWARRAGGAGGDDGLAVAANEDIFVTGTFEGTATFGQAPSTTTTLTSAGAPDIYLARYSLAGDLAWARGAGSPGLDFPRDVVIAPDKTVLLTGSYSPPSATFGLGESGATTLASAGSYDGFLARYNTDGHLAFAKRAASGPSFEFPNGLGVVANGTVFVGGSFWSPATVFGEGEPGQTILQRASGVQEAAFLARYDVGGKLAWAVDAQGATTTVIYGAASTNDGGCVVAGTFWGTGSTTFGRGQPGAVTLTPLATDLFVARYASNGALSWVKRAGSARGHAIGTALDAAPDGSVLVGGYVLGNVVFGAGEPGQTAVAATNSQGSDMFVARYDATGALAWVRHAGPVPASADQTVTRSVAATPGGGALATGGLSGSVTFGKGEAAETVLTALGRSDVFVARYMSDGRLSWAKRFGGAGFDEGEGITLAADGSVIVTGVFVGAATFGAGEPGETSLTAVGADMFLVKLLP